MVFVYARLGTQGGLSTGKSYVLKEQAKVFLKMFYDPLLRKHFCTVGSGQGIVFRSVLPFTRALAFLRKALEVVPAPAEELTDETAQSYVRKLVRLANHLRGRRCSGKSPDRARTAVSRLG
jgi:hypothetical protein